MMRLTSMRAALGALLLGIAPVAARAQERLHTRNVVLIVSDGLRWQEVFGGAADSLIDKRQGVEDTAAMRRLFGGRPADEARLALMPFFWETVARRGQVFGNRALGDDAHVTNGMKFSYPGYNEMSAGFGDPRIDRNDYGPNPNTTVFEWLNRQNDLSGKVMALASWDAFRDIFARARTGLWVRAGWEAPFPSPETDRQRLLDDLFRTTTRYWTDNTPDALTHASVLELIRTRKPRVLFVGYGETDEWAHERRYDLYLQSAHQVDANIAELWNTMQAMPEYRGTTTFIITCDHGRGSTAANWTDHGRRIDGAENVWIAVIGPDTPSLGEQRRSVVTQGQIAATIAALLGQDFNAAEPRAAPPLPGVLGTMR
jgi:arylsulfatase A-like enzyme